MAKMFPLRRSTWRLLLLIGLLPLTVLIAAALYRIGMVVFEQEPRDFWSAVEFASETITTTGYGADAQWDHPAMVIFVITLQFVGVVLTYMVVPMVLVPFLEERFEERLPQKAPKLKDHVVVYRYGPPVATMIEELMRSEAPLVLAESDSQVIRRLLDHKTPVVHRPLFEEALDGLSLADAKALVLNGDDEENAALAVKARQMGYTGQILALIEESLHESAMNLAGADIVFSPRQILGAALAARASQRIRPRVEGAQQLGEHIEVRELRLGEDSPLVGQSLRQAQVGTQTGSIVVGLWIRGVLKPLPSPDHLLEARNILIAVGSSDNLDRLSALTGGRQHIPGDRPFLVAGYGEVGQEATEQLREAGETVVVVDRMPRDGVDVVGNVLDPEVLERLDLPRLQGVILALDNDKGALFATVIAKHSAPDVPIIVRVNGAENVEPIHRAGADFALSIAEVAGRMLVQCLLRRETFSLDAKLHVDRLQAPRLAGQHPRNLDVRRRTGCSVVAVERAGDILVEVDDDFVFEASDRLLICGTAEANESFRQLYDS